MDITAQRELEMKIARQILQTACQLGLTVEIWNGGSEPEACGADAEHLFPSIGLCDEEEICFYEQTARANGTKWACIGSVLLIYGNSGWDLIADHTDSKKIDQILQPAEELAQKAEDCQS